MSLDGQAGTRLPEGLTSWGAGRKRRLRLRDAGSRRRNAVNRLLVLAAVTAIGFGGYEIWSVWDNRRTIDAACADLVPAGQVMALPYGGGRIEAGGDRIDATLHRGVCRLYSTEAGELTGTESGVRLFFEASVAVEPNAAREQTDHTYDALIDKHFRPYLDGPVGGGIPGLVTDSGVGVKLACNGDHEPDEGGVRNVVATAVSSTDGHAPLNSGRQMSQETRDQLARIAVASANRLGEQLGCEERLPDAPAHVPPVDGDFIDAADADGTCGWYAPHTSRTSIGGKGTPAFPDRAVETPADPDVWQEKCGLSLSADRAHELWQKSGDTSGDPKRPDEQDELWLSAQSWFGESAREVHIGDELGDDAVHAEPGKAGRDPEHAAWWASSVCDGRPAVHTMTLSSEYAQLAAPTKKAGVPFALLFRKYVEDVAERRGCARLTFPDPGDFATPRT